MAVCVSATTNPDGSLTLVQQPAGTDLSTCAYVLQTGAEVANSSLPNLTPDQASQIGVAVGAVWAIAWTFKQVAKVLEDGGNEEN